jgi:hypothetical protein
MYRLVWAVLLVLGTAAVGCGKVHATVDSSGPGSEAGGGACTTNDQCSAPTPICDPGNGCVECLQNDQCSAATPTCDTGTHTCRACGADADCDSNVCDLQSGMCVAEANVLYVSPSGADTANCTKATPCSIVTANALADQTRNNVKLAAGSYSVHLVMTNKTLVFYGVGATINGQGTNPVFEAQNSAHLRVVGVSLSAATGQTVIRCEGTTNSVDLFRTTVDNNSSLLLANPCTAMTVTESTLRNTSATAFQIVIVGPSVATFDRTHFVGAAGSAGLAGLSNATIHVVNSTFTKVGAAASHGAFSGGNYDVRFSTIVDGIVECSSQGAVGLTLDSSVVLNTRGDSSDTAVGIPSCTSVKNSIIFPMVQPVGATNLSADPQLKNIGADDYHLLVTSPALDHGDPNSTLGVDFDGTTRPQGAGRDSGAFEFKP